MQGSAASGYKYNNGNPIKLDSRRGVLPSDYDVAVISPKLVQRAESLGIDVFKGPLSRDQVQQLGLFEAQQALSKASKGELTVNFKVYKSAEDVYNYGKTIPFSDWRK